MTHRGEPVRYLLTRGDINSGSRQKGGHLPWWEVGQCVLVMVLLSVRTVKGIQVNR